jgi:glycerophosphoryl diester phosphodiesterase
MGKFMKTFMQWIRPKKQNREDIYRLLKGELPDIPRNIILYISNGANRVETSETVYRDLGGRHDICVLTQDKMRRRTQVKDVTFYCPDGAFTGFVLRRKHAGVWEWYTIEGAWHSLGADMPEMKLFRTGDELPVGNEKLPKTYILEARWSAGDGAYAGCGYPMFQNRLMAHALGGLDGKTYHNTLRAFDAAREQNYQYFELDIAMTTDKRLVLCHGWTEAQCRTIGMEYTQDLEQATYDRIMAKTVHGNSLMDAKTFYRIAKQYPQYRFQIDFHSVNGKEMKTRIELFLEDMNRDPEVLDRVLIQSYSRSMFEGMAKLYPFKYHQYLVGKNIDQVDDIINYALDHGICALALRMNLAKPALVNKIKKAGLYTLAYTVNHDLDVAAKLLQSGVDTLCTDFITPAMLEQPADSFGRYPFYVYYHAGTPDAESDYPDAKRLKSGIYEYKDMEIWENDGKRSLSKCRYRVEGKQFAGWTFRVKVENIMFWYGTDHMYHCKGDSNKEVELLVLSDEQQLPILTVKKNMRIVMVATWK